MFLSTVDRISNFTIRVLGEDPNRRETESYKTIEFRLTIILLSIVNRLTLVYLPDFPQRFEIEYPTIVVKLIVVVSYETLIGKNRGDEIRMVSN